MDTFDCETIQLFRGGAAGLGSFQEGNYQLLGKGDKTCQGEVQDCYWLCDGLYEDCVERFVIEHDGDADSGSDDTKCSGSDDGSGAEGGDESSMDD